MARLLGVGTSGEEHWRLINDEAKNERISAQIQVGDLQVELVFVLAVKWGKKKSETNLSHVFVFLYAVVLTSRSWIIIATLKCTLM